MISIRTLQALREYAERLSGEHYLRGDVREELLTAARRSAAILSQNVDPRDSDRAYNLVAEIESR